jgi:hypothetical protein
MRRLPGPCGLAQSHTQTHTCVSIHAASGLRSSAPMPCEPRRDRAASGVVDPDARLPSPWPSFQPICFSMRAPKRLPSCVHPVLFGSLLHFFRCRGSLHETESPILRTCSVALLRDSSPGDKPPLANDDDKQDARVDLTMTSSKSMTSCPWGTESSNPRSESSLSSETALCGMQRAYASGVSPTARTDTLGDTLLVWLLPVLW